MIGSDGALAGAVHVVQQALTPVFLLSGIGTLLNVFATRLGRVADQVDALAAHLREEPGRDRRLHLLRRRSQALDASVVLAALAAGFTCATLLALFFGELLGRAAATLLFSLFGLAIFLTLASITGFVAEMLLAASGVRGAVDRLVSESPQPTDNTQHARS